MWSTTRTSTLTRQLGTFLDYEWTTSSLTKEKALEITRNLTQWEVINESIDSEVLAVNMLIDFWIIDGSLKVINREKFSVIAKIIHYWEQLDDEKLEKFMVWAKLQRKDNSRFYNQVFKFFWEEKNKWKNSIKSTKKEEEWYNGIDYVKLRQAVLVLRAVNHKLRQRIIDLLEESDTMTVTDIYIKLRLEQSVASQHLATLRRAGVVLTERQGKFIYYSLDRDRLSQISQLVEELAG